MLLLLLLFQQSQHSSRRVQLPSNHSLCKELNCCGACTGPTRPTHCSCGACRCSRICCSGGIDPQQLSTSTMCVQQPHATILVDTCLQSNRRQHRNASVFL